MSTFYRILYVNLLLQDHTAQCSKFPVSCPNNCGGSFPREMVRLSILPFFLTSTDLNFRFQLIFLSHSSIDWTVNDIQKKVVTFKVRYNSMATWHFSNMSNYSCCQLMQGTQASCAMLHTHIST